MLSILLKESRSGFSRLVSSLVHAACTILAWTAFLDYPKWAKANSFICLWSGKWEYTSATALDNIRMTTQVKVKLLLCCCNHRRFLHRTAFLMVKNTTQREDLYLERHMTAPTCDYFHSKLESGHIYYCSLLRTTVFHSSRSQAGFDIRMVNLSVLLILQYSAGKKESLHWLNIFTKNSNEIILQFTSFIPHLISILSSRPLNWWPLKAFWAWNQQGRRSRWSPGLPRVFLAPHADRWYCLVSSLGLLFFK